MKNYTTLTDRSIVNDGDNILVISRETKLSAEDYQVLKPFYKFVFPIVKPDIYFIAKSYFET